MKKRYSLINYATDKISAYESNDIAEIIANVQDDQTTWIIVSSYAAADQTAITQLLSRFSITSVTAEEILDHNLLDYEGEYHDGMYIEFKVPVFDLETLETERLWGSVLLGKNFFLLFVEEDTDIFNYAIERERTRKNQIRHREPDYLLYLITRSIISKLEDTLFRSLVDRFEMLEDEVIASKGEPEILDKILDLREQVKPFYESVRRLGLFIDIIQNEENDFVGERVQQLFGTNLEKSLEALWLGYVRLRDWSKELMDIHRANVGERTNRVMHILTVVATIFLPVTFLSSLYGMNFENMSFLNDPYGYDKTLAIMVTIVVGMVVYMKVKKWI